MFDNVDLVLTKVLSLASVGLYTTAKGLGIAVSAAAELKDTWHFQLLQEMAFGASIIAALFAILTFHQNYLKKKRSGTKKHKH